MLQSLWADEFGVIVSAELVFILTLLVIGLVVGMSELQHAIISELDDVGSAIGKLNQTYCFTGFTSHKRNGGVKAVFVGSLFNDTIDDCDDDCDGSSELGCDYPVEEGYGKY